MKKDPSHKRYPISIHDSFKNWPDEFRQMPLRDLPLPPAEKRELLEVSKQALRSLSPYARRALRRKKPYPGLTETLNALRQGNPEPFFVLLTITPWLLRETEYWNLTVRKWFPRKLYDRQARENLLRIGKALAHAQGRISQQPDEEMRAEKRKEDTRRRKAKYDAKKKKERQALQDAITREKQQLPPAIRRDPARRQAAYEEIETQITKEWRRRKAKSQATKKDTP